MNSYDKAHEKAIRSYIKRIKAIMDKYTEEYCKHANSAEFDADKPFSFDDYPATLSKVKSLEAKMAKELQVSVEDGVADSWAMSNRKNDALVKSSLSAMALEGMGVDMVRRYFNENRGALDAFKQRVVNGMNLSQRVWKITEQNMQEMEGAIDIALRDGTSAAQLSRKVRGLLNEPDKLFRRVRDEHGVLHLSKNAKAYHPGQGVYRSSYKNAIRLAGTEINMAYRTADHLRYQQLDFVVGIEILTSPTNHPEPDICDELKGKYPKDFKFTGWHPNCRCHVETILKTPEEMDADDELIINGQEPGTGSVNEVRDMPEQFERWLRDNEDRIGRAQSMPYFLRDNYAITRNADGTLAFERILTPKKDSVTINQPETYTNEGEYRKETLEELKDRLGNGTPMTVRSLDEAAQYFIDEVDVPDYAKHKNYGDKAKKYASEIEDVMSELFQKHSYGMYVTEGDLGKVLESGRFKNQFETGTSHGAINSKFSSIEGKIDIRNNRLRNEHRMFMPYRSLEDQLHRSEYPKYGLLLDRDIEKSLSSNHAYGGQYGNIEIRFNKNKVVTTWTSGDSYGAIRQPSLTSDPKAYSYGNLSKVPRRGAQTDDVAEFVKDYTKKKDYIEIQYHGKLTVGDIESVSFPYDVMNSQNRNLAIELQNNGVKVYNMVDGKIVSLSATPRKKSLLEIAEERHAARTPEQIDAIKAKAAQRHDAYELEKIIRKRYEDFKGFDLDKELPKFNGDYAGLSKDLSALSDRLEKQLDTLNDAGILMSDVKSIGITKAMDYYDTFKYNMSTIDTNGMSEIDALYAKKAYMESDLTQYTTNSIFDRIMRMMYDTEIAKTESAIAEAELKIKIKLQNEKTEERWADLTNSQRKEYVLKWIQDERVVNKEFDNYLKKTGFIKDDIVITEEGYFDEKTHSILSLAKKRIIDNELKIYNHYVGTSESFGINRALYTNKGLLPKELFEKNAISKTQLETINALDESIQNSKIGIPMKAYRMAKKDEINDVFGVNIDMSLSNDEIAKRISARGTGVNYGFTSASTNPDLNVFTNRPFIYEINIPKGSRCYVTENSYESEIILPRQSKYKINSVRYDNKLGKVVINVDVIQN